MGKIKDLLIEATDYRVADLYCNWDEAYEWAMEQTIDYLCTYVEEKRKKSNISIDDVINYYLHKQLDEYENKALKLLMDYKDVLNHNLHMAKYE